MKLPPQVLLHPASHYLAKEMGCPEIAHADGGRGGSDECVVPHNKHAMYVTMSYAHDPWIDYLANWLMVLSYVLGSVLFMYSGLLALLSLKFLPKFKAKWTPEHCTYAPHAVGTQLAAESEPVV